ncbi:H-NS family nucleoid-associated regulatory protein [Yersinia bercovieri]|uniref:Histone-like nucleoid-structuring protein H-NS n=1 Tax=Yersinia bercovieri ATCC 43970 TaxID=349968 RepID=A0ABP2E1X6_YERBE|nr:H-NS family nucleoid-associated regulatory protein [Yersinia bercovieri]EEQ05834.1 Histone-like nucleoid-structuring protein H-NS [Yersinia bercovieri ATCC 43970]ELI8287808.1 H-NS histone family protein [Yersinia enterocolitica]QKJ09183.1 H-NS histone family protein [Yersinia bercovieri ATCC 43970]HEN3646968.1 H-NS histone family protein [Yersinia enterocolitica]
MNDTQKITAEDVSQFLNQLTRRKKVLRLMTADQINILISDAKAVLEDVIADEDIKKRQEAERQAKIKETAKLLRNEGIGLDDLEKHMVSRRSPTVEPKTYLINGRKIIYKGSGRMNKALKAIVDKEGHDALEKYLVRE